LKEFDELMSEILDVTFRQVFGDFAWELICKLVESHVFLNRDDIGKRFEAFYAYLEQLLGSERAQILQAASPRCLCSQVRQENAEVEKYFSFLDKLYEIKFRLSVSTLKRERSRSN